MPGPNPAPLTLDLSNESAERIQRALTLLDAVEGESDETLSLAVANAIVRANPQLAPWLTILYPALVSTIRSVRESAAGRGAQTLVRRVLGWFGL